MKVYKLDLDFSIGQIYFDNIPDLLDEIEIHLKESMPIKDGHFFSVSVIEMTEEEYKNMPEFEGY